MISAEDLKIGVYFEYDRYHCGYWFWLIQITALYNDLCNEGVYYRRILSYHKIRGVVEMARTALYDEFQAKHDFLAEKQYMSVVSNEYVTERLLSL